MIGPDLVDVLLGEDSLPDGEPALEALDRLHRVRTDERLPAR